MIVNGQVKVSGVVKDKITGRVLPYAFAINHRTQNGAFCDQKGAFQLNAVTTDTLLFSLTGYNYVKVFLGDSTARSEYFLNIFLELRPVELKAFTLKAPKTYDQIIRELEKAEAIKVKPTAVADAMQSPITYLYMQFSKEGKATRKIAELRAEDAKRELFKDLFTRYMIAHIIDLDENDADDFIAFSGLSDSYKTFESEYELVVYVKQRFADYKKYRGIED